MATGGSKIPLKTSNINMANNHWDDIQEKIYHGTKFVPLNNYEIQVFGI
jgi:hypothetical protein